MHTIDFPYILCGICRKQCDERMLLVGGFSPHRADTLLTMHQISSLHLTLSRPGAVQRENVILYIRAVNIQTGRHDFGQINRLFCCIFQDHAAGDHVFFFKRGIQKIRCQTNDRVRQMQDQGITVFFSREGGRQSRQRRLLCYDLMGDVL